jgi:hypothetical protein
VRILDWIAGLAPAEELLGGTSVAQPGAVARRTRHETDRIARGGGAMTGCCEVCGNEYDKAFEVIAAGQRHVFDSFECAIHKMAPVCEHCGCRVIGHGVEAAGHFYCCAHCARDVGVEMSALRA